MFFPWSSFNADITAPGDYNGNLITDAADYTICDTLGSTTDLCADGDGSLTIDQADYDIWKTAFGTAGMVGTSGLYAPSAPSNDDTWFYQMGQITYADPNNFLPVWNYTNVAPEAPIVSFTDHPHGEITFVGQPGPGFGVSRTGVDLAARCWRPWDTPHLCDGDDWIA